MKAHRIRELGPLVYVTDPTNDLPDRINVLWFRPVVHADVPEMRGAVDTFVRLSALPVELREAVRKFLGLRVDAE